MVLSNRKKWLAVDFILWYALCTIAPKLDFKFDFKLFVHDFSDPENRGVLVFFAKEFCLTYGVFLAFKWGAIFIKDSAVKTFFILGAIDFGYEIVELIVINNAYNMKSLIFQNTLLIIALLYLIRKYSHERIDTN